jgi:hypothetical protein
MPKALSHTLTMFLLLTLSLILGLAAEVRTISSHLMLKQTNHKKTKLYHKSPVVYSINHPGAKEVISTSVLPWQAECRLEKLAGI